MVEAGLGLLLCKEEMESPQRESYLLISMSHQCCDNLLIAGEETIKNLYEVLKIKQGKGSFSGALSVIAFSLEVRK